VDIEATFERKFISAIDLPDSGDVVATIQSVSVEELDQRDGPPARKPIVTLTQPLVPGGPARWVLNKTNTRVIKAIIGSGEPDAWVGQSVSLFRTEVQVGPEIKPAIRVRSQAPRSAPAGEHVLTDETPEDQIPF
jgi:hypothetical protein